MESKDNKVIKLMIATVKQKLKWRDEKLASVIRDGHKILQQEEILQEVNEFKRIYSEELPVDILRKLRHLKNISFKDIVENERYKNEFIKYCDILTEGIKVDESLDDEVIEIITNDISSYKNQVIDYKEKVEENIKMNKQHRGVRVNLMSEEIYDFLVDSDCASINDWSDIEENEQYEKYIVIGKEATFRLKGDYKELSFKVIEDPIENKVYGIVISSDDDLQIVEFDNVKMAIKFIVKCVNLSEEIFLTDIEKSYEVEYECFDKTIKKRKISYDTTTSFGEKIEYLLS